MCVCVCVGGWGPLSARGGMLASRSPAEHKNPLLLQQQQSMVGSSTHGQATLREGVRGVERRYSGRMQRPAGGGAGASARRCTLRVVVHYRVTICMNAVVLAFGMGQTSGMRARRRSSY